MKRLIFLLCFPLWLCGNASAQQIRSMEPTSEDAIEALKATGYEFFRFDLSALKDKTYAIQFYLKETDSTGTKEKFRFDLGMTRAFLQEMSEELRSRFTPIDSVSGLYKLVDYMSLYLLPGNDSTKLVYFCGKHHACKIPMTLRPLENRNSYWYVTRPFKLNEFESGADIPLVLYGSAWYDERLGGYRFCGLDEIDPDMSTEMLQYIPHYYVIGMRLTEIK